MSHDLSNFHHLTDSTCRIHPKCASVFLYAVGDEISPLSFNVVSELAFIGVTTVSNCCTRHVSTNRQMIKQTCWYE
jgi:hypothetical protein